MRRWPRRCITRELNVLSVERSATSCSILKNIRDPLRITAILSLHLLQDYDVCINYIDLSRFLPSWSLVGKMRHLYRRGHFDYRRFSFFFSLSLSLLGFGHRSLLASKTIHSITAIFFGIADAVVMISWCRCQCHCPIYGVRSRGTDIGLRPWRHRCPNSTLLDSIKLCFAFL